MDEIPVLEYLRKVLFVGEERKIRLWHLKEGREMKGSAWKASRQNQVVNLCQNVLPERSPGEGVVECGRIRPYLRCSDPVVSVWSRGSSLALLSSTCPRPTLWKNGNKLFQQDRGVFRHLLPVTRPNFRG